MTLLKEKTISIENENTAKFSLSPEFWSGFFEQSWGKFPHILRKPLPALLSTPDEVLSGLVRASDLYRDGSHNLPISFFIEYAKQLVDLPEYLPNSNDASIDDYAKRIVELLNRRKFGLIAEHFQMYDPQVWFRIREFLAGLYEFTGLPGEDTKATIFLGNYKRTPLGLHKGSSHNFMFVIQGRKRIRLWPKKYFSKTDPVEHSVKYDNFIEDSILLEGEPGDILYWPSGYWHIGESVEDGELAMGLSIALFMDTKRSAVGWNTVARLLQARLESRNEHSNGRFHLMNFEKNLESIPLLAEQSRRAIREIGDDASLEQAVQVSVLNYLTAFGFTRVPVLSLEGTLEEDDMISGIPGAKILWIPWNDDQVLCSVNGHAFTMPDSEDYLQLLRRLNRGSCRTVRKFISTCDMPHIAHQLLQKLYSLGSVLLCG